MTDRAGRQHNAPQRTTGAAGGTHLGRRTVLAGLSGLLGLGLLPGSARAAALSSVHIRGSGTVMTPLREIAELYMAADDRRRVILSGGGSWWGVKSVIDGSADIGMASWNETAPDLIEFSHERTISLTKRIFARDAVIPIVNPANPLQNLSLAQLRDLFRGRVTNWAAVGGPDLPVMIASGSPYSGTFTTWNERVLGQGAVITPAARVMTNRDMQDFTAANPGAIAYSGMGRLVNGVRSIAIDGVSADQDSIAAGRFPIVRDMALYSRSTASPATRDFIAFCFSSEAAAIVRRQNAIPLPENSLTEGAK